MVSPPPKTPYSEKASWQLAPTSIKRASILNAGNKFLALTGFVFALLVVYREAPVTVILLVIALLAVAYAAVTGDRQR